MKKKRILITGGAGFLGSHLCEELLKRGNEIICVDNFFTGSKQNIVHLFVDPFFERAIRNLDKDNPLGHIYRQEEGKLNFFKSRKAVDQLMIGLMKLRQGGWINDNEYIRLQEVIIGQIHSISQP